MATLEEEALHLLRESVGDPSATFRDGQLEAIVGLVRDRKRLLVVQCTGWGKSNVYFIAARLLRERGAGPTLIISPLLALMRNQLHAAKRTGIRAVTINGNTWNERHTIKAAVKADEVDAILISPEQLARPKFVNEILLPIASRVSLLVVDEAHCISDWGHDFRPDYRRIVSILKRLPSNLPVLGTTATANDRVINDLKTQLGDVHIERGSLVRGSLRLQAIQLPSQAERLAWLAEYVPKLPNSGIIYTLTSRDADLVTRWLKNVGINAEAYYAKLPGNDEMSGDMMRVKLEEDLLHDGLKVLVATSALGMGYDKADLGFVIHFQAPASIISYYQQVGRAGRKISKAYGILLHGQEDERINAYFQESAFPTEKAIDDVLKELGKSDGLGE